MLRDAQSQLPNSIDLPRPQTAQKLAALECARAGPAVELEDVGFEGHEPGFRVDLLAALEQGEMGAGADDDGAVVDDPRGCGETRADGEDFAVDLPPDLGWQEEEKGWLMCGR